MPDISDTNNKNNSISDYENHFALRGMGKGCSKQLLGKVCIVAFLIQEAKSAWKKDDIEKCKAVLEKAQSILRTQSGKTENRLHVVYAMDVVSVQLKFDRDFYEELETNVLKQYGNYTNAAAYQHHYEKKFLKDEAPVVFILNKNFRSFALTSHTEDTGNETSFVSYNDDIDKCARTLVHELLHQFGAIDYYLPETVKAAAEKYFPDSIMKAGGERIDPLTRYIIGWDEEPEESVLSFLEETKDVTDEEIREAHRKDEDNDW